MATDVEAWESPREREERCIRSLNWWKNKATLAVARGLWDEARFCIEKAAEAEAALGEVLSEERMACLREAWEAVHPPMKRPLRNRVLARWKGLR